jgi:Family of unknown function (DUF6428)
LSEFPKTHEFIALLRHSPKKQLVFTNENGTSIHSGYHLTESKAAAFDMIDCCGQKNQWRETIAQLWVPNESDDDFIDRTKVSQHLRQGERNDRARFRSGDSFRIRRRKFLSVEHHLESVTQNAEKIRVRLRPPQATCNARDRAGTEKCCA